MTVRSKILRMGFLLLLCIGTYWFSYTYLAERYNIRYNVTESVPYTLFLGHPIEKVERSSYVSFYRADNYLPLVKEIKGIPGDIIETIEKDVYVNGQYCGHAKPVSNSGKEYTAIESQIIPPGYIYVFSPHPNSFDSRYAEFGLVKIADLTEALWAIY